MTRLLRVGIIGASAQRGWAKESHVPAVQKLGGFELVAVATRDQKSADAAARAFGARRGYGDASDLLRDPDVDLVTVSVKVPAHRALVLGALAAGKHLYCEWPLARDVGEAEELREAAHAAGVHVAIGLQARMSPAVRRARELIAVGQIGRVLSARLYAATVAFGRKVATGGLYLEEAVNGATLITVMGGHALDLAMAVLGELADVAALATTQYPEIEIGDQGERRSRSIPDHLLTQSRLRGGAALAVEVAGGRPPDAPFRLEVVGEDGTLALDGGAPGGWGFEAGRIRLSLNGEPQSIDEGEAVSMPDTAANVASVYEALRDDIANATSSVPDFDHAVRLTRLMADVAASSETGARLSVYNSQKEGKMTSNAEEQAHPFLGDDLQAQHLMAVPQPTVRVMRPEDFDAHTPQTSGMQRKAAISSKLVGSKGICAGYTIIEKNSATGLHHHGEQETVIYVKSGEVKVRWGAQLEQEALAQTGSFVYIPAFLPHQEINPSDTVSEWVIIRNGPEPIVVNLE